MTPLEYQCEGGGGRMPRSGVMVDANWHSKFGSVVSGVGKGMMWARGERTERGVKRGKQEKGEGR